jgi:hypothetical protein
MTEPRIVVADREHLWWLLAEAEHMIIHVPAELRPTPATVST